MGPQAQEVRAEEGLSCSVLRFVDEPERIERLRHLLRGFNHRCRNSLNGIKMSLYLSRRQWNGATPPFWGEIEQTYQQIERLFDRLQVIYKPLSMTMVRSPLSPLFAERLPAWRSWFTQKGLDLQINPPERDDAGDFDPMHLGLGLDAFVAWRAEEGSTFGNPLLSWRVVEGDFEIAWSEGHCVSAEVTREPDSRRACEKRPASTVDSLALPLLIRILSAHGGSHETSTDPAFALKLRWPRFKDREATANSNESADVTSGP
jgi:hypothetical protein